MATLNLLPFDPCTALMESVASLIRGGVANCAAVTDPDNVAWTEGETSPAEHYLVPEAGWHLLLDREPEQVDHPCIILSVPEDAKEKAAGVDGFWSVQLLVRVEVESDYSIDALEAVLQRLQVVLTQALVLDDDSVQTPQARLSNSGLHIHGLRKDDNFDGASTGKVESDEGHPARLLGMAVTCSLLYSGD